MKIFAKKGTKELVMKKGYSITDLADEIGISRQGLHQCMKNQVGIKPKYATKITEILKEDFDSLFEFVERKSNQN